MNLEAFDFQPLRGGFLLVRVVVNVEPMFDAMGRSALARTSIVGANISIELSDTALTPEQISVSIYHEVLEAATVGAQHPPAAVCELNELGFESAAHEAHAKLGPASPENLNRMLEGFGF